MKLTWYGHAAFALENSAGTKIILDPYNYPECGGYLPIDEAADLVCISHDNPRYHSDVSAIRPPFELIEALSLVGKSHETHGLHFEAFEVYEDSDGEGPNAMVKFTLDEVTIAHQGDLGHRLEGKALDFLRDVDVLLALAGGPPTLQIDDLMDLIRETRPAIVIPMHYKTPKVNLNLLGVESFVDLCIDEFTVERPEASILTVTASALPTSTTVVVLEHAR